MSSKRKEEDQLKQVKLPVCKRNRLPTTHRLENKQLRMEVWDPGICSRFHHRKQTAASSKTSQENTINSSSKKARPNTQQLRHTAQDSAT